MLRNLIALVQGAGVSSDIQVAMARMLLADIHGSSVTPDNLILILVGLGVILNPTIVSITPIQTFKSITPVLSINLEN
jgi:hypothetical protein